MVPPVSATLPPPSAAMMLPPAQVVVAPWGAAFTRLAGYISVNAAPVIAVAFGLVSVIVSTDAAFAATATGANALAMVGRASTVNVALAATAVPALVVVTAPVV